MTKDVKIKVPTNFISAKKKANIEKHLAWHRFWRNATLKEIINYLSHCSNKQFKHNKDWQIMWGNKTTRKVIAILKRLQSIKSYQRYMYSFLYE